MSQIKEGNFIKCPACGSTSQVEMVWGSASDSRYSRIEREIILAVAVANLLCFLRHKNLL